MKILNLDIECSPAKVYIWDLKTRYVPPDRIIEPKRMLCFAAKWLGEPKVYFYSVWHDGRAKMLRRIWELLDECDAVLHYNGIRFDIPNIQAEFLIEGLLPPSPYKQIDLYKTVVRKFGLMSRSLDQVSKAIGTSRKLEHEGFALWPKVMAGEPEACKKMRLYNIQDVRCNEETYERLLPWIVNHPNRGLYDGKDCCPSCGSAKIEPRGLSFTAVSSFQQYQCLSCGRWMKDAVRVSGARYREAT